MKESDLPPIQFGFDLSTEDQAIAHSEALSEAYKDLIANLEGEISSYSDINNTDHEGTEAEPDLAVKEDLRNDDNRDAPSELAWSLGCLIWKIYNPGAHDIDLKSIVNIPVNLLSFYRSCLSKYPSKRPELTKLQECFNSYPIPSKPSTLSFKQKDKGKISELVNGEVRSPEAMSQDVDEIVVGVGGHNLIETEVGSHGDAGADEVVAGVEQVEKASENVNPLKHKLHLCLLCGKGFARNSNLKRHVRSGHTEDLEVILPAKEIKCEFCSKSYNKKHHMQRHVLSVHKNKAVSNKKEASHRAKKTFTTSGDLDFKLSPYEKIRENNIKQKLMFLEALNSADAIINELLNGI